MMRFHHLISKSFAPFLEALVGGEHGWGVFVMAAHKLEEHQGASLD